MKKKLFLIATVAAVLMAGCQKDPEENNTPETNSPCYVLSEGSWGGNNASISLMDSSSINNEWFTAANGRGLGDLAQDLIHYGSRLYVTVNGSNTFEAINPATGKSIKQIDLGTRGPRYMVAHNGKVYVSCYDKTVIRIDTASLEIEATCSLSGMQPEQMCVIGNNLYVCNCWQYDASGNAEYDNTVSVVDLASFTETRKITVSDNPGRIKAIDDHRFVVTCAGNYYDVAAKTLVVDVNSNTQTELSVAASNMDVCNGTIYLYCTEYDANWNTTTTFYRVDGTSLTATPMLQDFSSTLSSAYGINVDPKTKNLYICNCVYGSNGDVYVFNTNGTELYHVEAGIYANKVVF